MSKTIFEARYEANPSTEIVIRADNDCEVAISINFSSDLDFDEIQKLTTGLMNIEEPIGFIYQEHTHRTLIYHYTCDISVIELMAGFTYIKDQITKLVRQL